MVKVASLVSVLIFSALFLSACRTDRHSVMGLTNAQIAPAQTAIAR